MKNTLIVISTHQGMQHRTFGCVQGLLDKGASIIIQANVTGLSIARNMILTNACQVLEKDSSIDTVLMIDDDMTFTNHDADLIVSAARQYNEPISACYVDSEKKIVARKIVGPLVMAYDTSKHTRYVCGLGFLAIPRDNLLRLRDSSTFVASSNIFEFTWTASEETGVLGEQVWLSEDYRLCLRLGGINLVPIMVGHLKRIPLKQFDTNEEMEAFLLSGKVPELR